MGHITTFSALLLSIVGSASASTDKLDPIINQEVASGSSKIRCIVQLNRPLGLLDQVTLPHGLGVNSPLANGSLVTALLPAPLVKLLAEHPLVARISIDALVSPTLTVTDRSVMRDTGAWRGNLSATLDGYDGDGCTVAVIDSGIANVPGLNPVWFVDVPAGKQAAGSRSVDPYGHGTHVAGIIAGVADPTQQGEDFTGTAPHAKLISVKVLDANGQGYTSDVIRALDWCIANRKRFRINVVNLSLSHPIYESYRTDPLCQSVERAWKAGIVVVCSAGNMGRDGYATIGSPGNDPYVLTVGAMNAQQTPDRADDVAATYSSKGPSLVDLVLKPDVVAPGNRVVSWASPGSTLDGMAGLRRAGTPMQGTYPFIELSGTSMAAPAVAGLVAAMLEKTPSATPGQIKARLMASAERRSEDVFTQGAGYVDALAALDSTADPGVWAATSPGLLMGLDGTFDLLDPVTGESLAWGDRVVWGDLFRRTSSAFWGDTSVWGDLLRRSSSALWGDTDVTGDALRRSGSALWGDTELTGDGTTTVN